MSNYYSSSITIKIPKDNFDWLDRFINNIYSISDVYVESLNKLDNPRYFKLEKAQAQNYFENYIKRVQERSAINDPPSITWDIRDTLNYTVVFMSEQGYLSWIIYLSTSLSITKYPSAYSIDFEHYIRNLLTISSSLPVMRVWAGCDEEYGDPEWFAIDGCFWPLRIREPQPEESFQMLSILVAAKLEHDLLIGLVEQAYTCNYQFFPRNAASQFMCPEKIIEDIARSTQIPEKWTYACEDTTYTMDITVFEGGYYTRLLFHTTKAHNTPSLEILINEGR